MNYVSSAFPDTLSVKGIFTALYRDFSARKHVTGEAHDFPEIIYIIKGKHPLYLDSKPYELREGEMMIYAPGAYHESRGRSDASAYIISFEFSRGSLSEIYNRVITLTPSQRRTYISIMENALACFTRRKENSALHGMIPKDSTSEYELARIRAQLEFFLIDIQGKSTEKSRSDADFERVTEYLEEHICENLSLSDIAKGAGMSVSKLKMIMRSKFGGGAVNYFIAMKIEEAKRLIDAGNYNFTEISDLLGFSSLHYFSRLFKKVAGVTPTEFKKGVFH